MQTNTALKLARRLGDAALLLLFPTRCSSCDEPCDEGAAFCRSCSLTLMTITAACARCGLPTERPVERCLRCLAERPAFAGARAPFEFGGALARAVRRLKWARVPSLARPLARLLPAAALRAGDVLVPVPLHPRRLRSREFNQAALLALGARAAHAGLPPLDLFALERVRDTPPQSTLGVALRQANVRGAFAADRARVRGKGVVLLDDVLTTGATASACAEALLDGGARRVVVLTLARAMP